MSQDNKSLHDTAALRALAGDEELPEELEGQNEFEGQYIFETTEEAVEMSSRASAETDGDSASESQSLADAAADVFSRQASTPTHSSGTNGGAKRYHRPNYHVGIQFRKTIIPVLLAMAMILIALGIFTLVKVNKSSPQTIANNPFLDNGGLFAGVSIALGACLIAGSLFFHYEVRKHRRENGGKK